MPLNKKTLCLSIYSSIYLSIHVYLSCSVHIFPSICPTVFMSIHQKIDSFDTRLEARSTLPKLLSITLREMSISTTQLTQRLIISVSFSAKYVYIDNSLSLVDFLGKGDDEKATNELQIPVNASTRVLTHTYIHTKCTVLGIHRVVYSQTFSYIQIHWHPKLRVLHTRVLKEILKSDTHVHVFVCMYLCMQLIKQ